MTYFDGTWSSNGHTDLGADWWYVGNVLYVQPVLATHWSYSNNGPMTLSYSGTLGSGSLNPGNVTRSNPSQANIGPVLTFTQAYNSLATVNLSLSGFYEGAAATCSVSFNTWLGPLPPNASTIGAATYVSDAQINLAWTNNPTSDRPVPTNNVYRDDNTVGVSLVYSGAATTAFSDTGLVADRKFRYYVDAANSAGVASSARSSYVYTTPAACSSVTAAKTPTSGIKVDWVTASTYAADCTVQIQESTDGGTTWSANLATPAASLGTWTHTAPNAGLTHKYRVRMATPTGGLYSAWTTMTGVVQLLAKPNPPTGLAMSAAYRSTTIAAADATGTITLGWVHNPQDSSAQSAYETGIQISTDGGATWGAETLSGKVTSTTSARVLAANTFVNNRTIRWRVRTWGLYAGTAPTYSDWSSYDTFTTNAKPTSAVTGSGTWASSTLTQTGSYLDTEGTAQTGALWVLKDYLGNTLETISAGAGDPTLTTVTFATRVADGATYTLAYRVRDGAGLWSVDATKSIPVVYAKPPQPTLTLAWSDDTGAVTGQITNPAGSPAVVYNVVYRNGVPLLALSNTLPNGVFVDRIPPVNQAVVYTVIAVSALPSSSIPSAATSVTTTSAKAWINGGLGMSMSVALPYNPALAGTQQRGRKWVGYDTKPTETMYTGPQRQRQYQVTGLLYPAELAALLALEDQSQTACYRDPSGRKAFVGFASGVAYTDGVKDPTVKSVTMTFRACGYSE